MSLWPGAGLSGVAAAIVGMLRFDGAVQEIFDVSVLPGMLWPTLLHRGEATADAFVLTQEDMLKVGTGGS